MERDEPKTTPAPEDREALVDRIHKAYTAIQEARRYGGLTVFPFRELENAVPEILTALRAQAPAVCVSQNGSDVTQAGLSKADETQAPAVCGDVVRSWHPEDHLPADPTVRPPDGDIAGWCRFYAWHYGDEPWGVGKGDYGGGCQDICFQDAADEIDRLRAALPTIADARASALEEAAGVAEQLGQVVNARGLDNNLEAFAEDIAAAIRKLKDL